MKSKNQSIERLLICLIVLILGTAIVMLAPQGKDAIVKAVTVDSTATVDSATIDTAVFTTEHSKIK